MSDSQANGSPPPSPDPAPKPAGEQKPSFLSQWLQNRKEQVRGNTHTPIHHCHQITKTEF